jgi:excisionase family DNA binding protein
MIISADDDAHNPDDLLPYKEVAQTLRLTTRTVARRVDAGDLAVVIMNGKPRIRRAELTRYLRSLEGGE